MQAVDALANLLRKKQRLENTLSEHRSKVIEAERAITLCSKLTKELPAKIAALKALPAVPSFSNANPVEDGFSLRDLFAKERRAVESLNRLLKDLPEIRRFWETRRQVLTR
jgi:hypothetical protein